MTRRQELLTLWEERIALILEDDFGVISAAETAEYERVKRNAQMEREWTAGNRSRMLELQ